MLSTNQNLVVGMCCKTHAWMLHYQTIAYNNTKTNIICSQPSIQGLSTNTIYKCLQNAYLFDRFICLQQHYMRCSSDDITHLSTSVQNTMGTKTQVIIVWVRTPDVGNVYFIIIFVNLRFFRHFETVTNIRTWINSHRYWRML